MATENKVLYIFSFLLHYDESIMQAKRERRKAERLFRKSKTEINKEMFKSKQKLAYDLVSKNKQL